MELLFVFAPGFLASALTEKLQKTKFSGYTHFKYTVIFDFFINLATILFYQYVYHGEGSIIGNFCYNDFIIRFSLLNIVWSVLLSLLYHFLSPYISVTVENVSKRDSRKESIEQDEK